MRDSLHFTLIAFAACAAAWDTDYAAVPTNYSSRIAGFNSPTIVTSSNGSAICIQGNIPVYASAKNIKLKLPIPANQTVVTQTFADQLAAGSTFLKTVIGEPSTVSGTYNINAQLCYPRNTGINASTVQILTHGIGFDKSYWDVAPGYSYVDVAAASGYTTFLYDRLGNGLSDHPDAIQVLQAPLEVAILHELIEMLKNGTFASTSFKNVIGTGHSFGSALTQAITYSYPKDIAAAVLTGFTTNSTGQPTFTTSLDLTIANQADPLRFSGLSNGYLVANNYIGNQFSFFRAPGFPASNLAIGEASKQTVTFGELLTLSAVIGPATNFTGPIDVVDGSNDWPFCMGNCSYPTNLAAAVKGELYPAASNGSQWYLVANSGHGINLHYSATAAFTQIMDFLKTNGL